MRSKCQPNTEFPRTRADRECQDAGDANHRYRQRNGGEHAEYERVQSVGRKHFGADIREGGSVLDRLIGGHLADDTGDRHH